jgi:hypothetical protein
VLRRRWYHILMKLFCGLLGLATALVAAPVTSVNPQLHQVKRVYILAMASGMDQFLANQLTKEGIVEVVTDPKKADAILTDNVGESFQSKLDDLYPPPKPAEAAKTKPAADSGAPAGNGDSKSSSTKQDALSGVDLSGGNFTHPAFGRGKGNFFIVDRNSRVVLWSIYERSKDSTPGELTKTAARVVKHLKEDLAGPKAAE